MSFIDSILTHSNPNLRCLVLCPLSVLETWKDEIQFSENLKSSSTIIHGTKEERLNCYDDLLTKKPLTIVTNYETLIHDRESFLGLSFDLLIVDEAHRLKNSNAVLYRILSEEVKIQTTVLLTGTPIQNNLTELYNLLSLIDHKSFQSDDINTFLREYSSKNGKSNEKLLNVLKRYVLRRTKKDVSITLPTKTEVLIYHGLTSIQKKLYKSILLKDTETLYSLSSQSTAIVKRTSLNNILIQLRKCCLHPYLFQGVEPEPFMIGDHLILASQKLVLLDLLLEYLLPLKHKVLIFSQFTTMLDILQDYLEYKRFVYERLDGSCRSEERFLSIKNFNKNQTTAVFLLSTKAGGQGITLTSADTVIFCDSDFNPQNDIQAAARAHRIGQERPVKVIKLVCRNSVEEIIISRAQKKAQLSHDVLDTGDLQGKDMANDDQPNVPTDISEVVKFGLDVILSDVDSTDNLNVNFDHILGITDSKGCWSEDSSVVSDSEKSLKAEEETEVIPETIYDFDGENFKTKMKESNSALDNLVTSLLTEIPKAESSNAAPKGRPKRTLTAEQIEAQLEERIRNEAKRAKLQEEQKLEREEKRKKKLEAMWQESGYESLKLVESEERREQNGVEDVPETEDESSTIRFVSGDATKPVSDSGEVCVIIHCVDNSGGWGEGGMFSALNNLGSSIGERYELAADMKDLTFGDTHLIKLSKTNICVALIVAQKRSSKGTISDIDNTVLDKSFKLIAQFAKKESNEGKIVGIHSPRLGHSMKTFNWYCAERLMRKHFVSKGLKTCVYYYSRSRISRNHSLREVNGTSQTSSNTSQVNTSGAHEINERNADTSDQYVKCDDINDIQTTLPNIFNNLKFEISSCVASDMASKLERYIIAFDGEVVSEDDSESSEEGLVYVGEQNEITDRSNSKFLSVQQLVRCIKLKLRPKL